MAMSSNISSCILPSSQRCGCILPSSQKRCSPLLRSVELHSKPRPQLSMTPPFSVRTLGLLETFSNLKEKGKVAFIPYITAGDPDLRTTIKALKLLDSCGSDIIELGMPYSDPFVDGPVIQASVTRALTNGTNFNAIISMLTEVIPQLSCPIVLFSYFNPIYKRGITKFMSTISNAGVHGLVVPDIPLEETRILRSEARKHNIEMVLLTTPITPTERMKAITKASEGFVYLVRSAGVTGNHAPVSSNVQSLLQEIKENQIHTCLLIATSLCEIRLQVVMFPHFGPNL